MKERNKKEAIKNILENYQTGIKEINYYLLKSQKKICIEEDNKRLVHHIIKNTKTIMDKLTKEEKEKVEARLSYSIKSDIKDGIRQRNAYHRIYCEMKRKGIQEPELTRRMLQSIPLCQNWTNWFRDFSSLQSEKNRNKLKKSNQRI